MVPPSPSFQSSRMTKPVSPPLASVCSRLNLYVLRGAFGCLPQKPRHGNY